MASPAPSTSAHRAGGDWEQREQEAERQQSNRISISQATTTDQSNGLEKADASNSQGQRRASTSSSQPVPAEPNLGQQQQQHQQQAPWLAQVASQTQQGVRQRMSQASDQLGHSLRQLYASASSITTAANAAAHEVPPPYQNIPGIVPYYRGRSIGPPPSYDDVINPHAPPPTYQSLFGQMREARKSSRSLLDLLRRLLIILLSTLGCTILIGFMILIPFTMIIVGAIYIDECKIEHIPAFLLLGGLVWASKNILHCYTQFRKVEQLEQSEALAAELYLGGGGGSSSGVGRSEGAGGVGGELGGPSASEASSGGEQEFDEVDELQLGQRLAANQHDRRHYERHQEQRGGGGGIQRGASQVDRRLPIGGERRTSRFKSSVCESLLSCVLFGWFIAGCVIVMRNYEPDFDNPASARYCHRTVYMYTFWLIISAVLSLGLFIGCICCLMVSSALASRQPADLEAA